MTLELRIHQDAAQIGMSFENNAHEIVGVAFEPIGARPDGNHAVDLGPLSFSIADACLEPQPMSQVQRMQVHHHLEARLAIGEIHAAEVDHHLHVAARIVTQKLGNGEPSVGSDDQRFVSVLAVRLEHRRSERLLQDVEKLLTHAGALGWSLTNSAAGSCRGLTMPGVRSPRAILSWSNMSPSKTASGRGGQPGM